MKTIHGIRVQDPTSNWKKLEKYNKGEIGGEIITQIFFNFPKAHGFPDGESKRVPSTISKKRPIPRYHWGNKTTEIRTSFQRGKRHHKNLGIKVPADCIIARLEIRRQSNFFRNLSESDFPPSIYQMRE